MSTGASQFDADPSRKSRGWARLWQTPLFVLGAIAFAVVAATAPLRDTPSRDLVRNLRQFREYLRAGALNAEPPVDIETLLAAAETQPRYQAECEFLVGSYYHARAENEANRADWDERARQHLSRAMTLVVGQDDLAPLMYRLGISQYRLNQRPSQALGWVRQGLDLGAENPAAGYAFLVDAYLKLSPPDLAAALSACDRHLEYVNDRDPEAIVGAKVRRAEILLGLERPTDALKELESLGDGVSPALLARMRRLQAVCCEAEGQWTRAAEFWTQLLPVAGEIPGGKAHVVYNLGLVHSRREPADEAAIASNWSEAIALGGPEGQAAGIRLAHRLATTPGTDASQAVKLWSAALENVRSVADFKNPLLDANKTIILFEEACDRLLDRGEAEHSRSLAQLMAKVAPPGAAEEKLARSSMRWAEELATKAPREPAKADSLLTESRSRYQDAGDAFKQASQYREIADRIELIWNSSQCYLAARDATNAALMLEKFMSLTQTDPRRAQGHFALAEAYQSQSQRAKACAHYHKCIELGTPPFADRARWKLAQSHIEARKLEDARATLVQIVASNGPQLEREILEQAMFALGQVLIDLGEDEEAAVRLREAIRQFPNNSRVWAVREKLAEQAWERAKQITAADLNGSPERRPLAELMRQKRREALIEAHEAFVSLANDLHSRMQKQPLDAGEVLLLRNSLFNAGYLKVELGNIPEAISHFQMLQKNYVGNAESLHAAWAIHASWVRLAGQAAERDRFRDAVLDSIRQAQRDLDRIPHERDQDVFLSPPTPFSRDQWRRQLAEWESALLRPTFRPTGRFAAPE
jgi:tetratricopeptide (TPR) repeat protein